MQRESNMAAKRVRIPRGEEKEDVEERREFLKIKLRPLIGSKVKCPALDNRIVYIVSNSVNEIAVRASKRYKSTLVALKVKEAIENAEFVKAGVPDTNSQKVKFRFKKVFILKGTLPKVGAYKLVVGELKSKKVLQYCITHKRTNK